MKLEISERQFRVLHNGNQQWRDLPAAVAGPIKSGLFPPAIRWIGGDGQFFLVERPPEVLSLGPEHHRIALPWTLMLISFSNRALSELDEAFWFARHEPLMSEADTLYHLALPGIALDGRIDTLPRQGYRSYRQGVLPDSLTMSACVRQARRLIAEGLTGIITATVFNDLTTPDDVWAALGTITPMEACDLPWPPSAIPTLGNLLQTVGDKLPTDLASYLGVR